MSSRTDVIRALLDENKRLRDALIKCLRTIDGFAGEGLHIPGLDDPSDLFTPTCEVLGMTQEQMDEFGEEKQRLIELHTPVRSVTP